MQYPAFETYLKNQKKHERKVIFAKMAIIVLAVFACGQSAVTLSVLACHTEPTQDNYYQEGNLTCEDFGFEHGIKIDPAPQGDGPFSYTDGTLNVDITNINESSFDWTSNLGVSLVFVKAGRGGNVYNYESALASGGSNLGSPDNKDISHINFCYVVNSEPSPSPSPSESPCPSPSPSPSCSPSPSPSPTPSESPCPSPSPSPSESPCPSPSPSPCESPSPTPSPSETPSPSPTPCESPTPTPTPSESPSPTPSPSESPSPSPSPSESPSPSPSPSPSAVLTSSGGGGGGGSTLYITDAYQQYLKQVAQQGGQTSTPTVATPQGEVKGISTLPATGFDLTEAMVLATILLMISSALIIAKRKLNLSKLTQLN